MCLTETSQVSNSILAYLAKHPDAQDTVEGITDWWLLQRRREVESSLVQQALLELTQNGLILKRKGRDARIRYRLNKSKLREIRKAIENESS
jgi:DNA-binding IscR family transcriptional regulator